MITKSDYLQNEKRVLTLVSNNPQPQREIQPPTCWLLHSREHGDVKYLVLHIDLGHPRAIAKEAP
jgi:hypothetical protein